MKFDYVYLQTLAIHLIYLEINRGPYLEIGCRKDLGKHGEGNR